MTKKKIKMYHFKGTHVQKAVPVHQELFKSNNLCFFSYLKGRNVSKVASPYPRLPSLAAYFVPDLDTLRTPKAHFAVLLKKVMVGKSRGGGLGSEDSSFHSSPSALTHICAWRALVSVKCA